MHIATSPYFQAILVGGLCPTAEDVAGCEANLPGFWAAIAAVLWPGYWDPSVSQVVHFQKCDVLFPKECFESQLVSPG